MKTLSAVLFCLTGLLCAALSCLAEDAAPRPLIILATDFPPYEYVDNGKPAGINVEVTDRILKTLGVPYEIHFYPWTRAWLMVEKGKADAVLSVAYSPSREPFLYYTEAQRQFPQTQKIPPDYLWLADYVFFINRRFEKSLHFDSYAQLKADGYRIGTNTEYTYSPEFVAAGLNNTAMVDPKDSIMAMLRGEIDLFPLPRAVGQALAKRQGVADDVTYLPKPLFTKPYLCGFVRKSDYPGLEGLMKKYYTELRRLRASGEYAAILGKHAQPLLKSCPRPLLFICEPWPPFEYEVNGEPKGLDVEVVDRIMKRLGIPYRISFYPWTRAWLMVEKGKADAVLSISYNAAREGILFYTDEQRALGKTGQLPPDYLWLSEYYFFVKKNRTDKLRFDSYEQIRADGYRVGINKGYTYCPAFPLDTLNTREYFDTRDGFRALIDDEIDVYPMDKTVGLAAVKALGLSDSIVMLPKPIFAKPYLAPFVKQSDFPRLEAVMYAFYQELRSMRATGEYQAIWDSMNAAPAPDK